MRRVYSIGGIGEGLTDRERKNLAILESIRREGQITKTEISKATRLNIVTVSNYVNHFVEAGLVLEKGLDVSEGGRRPMLIELNSKYGYAVGVGLSMTDIVGIITDLSGNILMKVKREKPRVSATTNGLTEESGEILVEGMISVAEEVLSRSNVPREQIRGLGVGIPGIIDEPGGTIRLSSEFGDSKDDPLDNISMCIPVRDLFEKRFDLPIFIENDATVAAFGVLWLGLEPGIRNMIYMYSEVGCGIIIDGQIYRGASGSAGELSIIDPWPGDDSPDKWHLQRDCILRTGDLDINILQKAEEALKANSSPSGFLAKIKQDKSLLSIHQVIDAAKDGDPFAVSLIEDAGDRLGIKVAFLVNLLNPEVVVVGGGIEAAGSILLDPIKKRVKSCAYDEPASRVKVVPSRLGDGSIALGAACLVIQSVFAQA
ncbi:MAG: ROK family transcriptional regulator [Candidatus Omnitrophica bacterium]|nr:ROK family transcriptional regulator [Candidatus Omnitrophota bacterium]